MPKAAIIMHQSDSVCLMLVQKRRQVLRLCMWQKL